METTMFWQIVVLVTYALILSTALSVALAVYIFKMWPAMMAKMVAELEESDTSFEDHVNTNNIPDLHFPPSLDKS